MLSAIIGIVLLVITFFMFRWALPRNGNPSPVPTKYGLATIFPMLILMIGVAGVTFLIKGFL